MSRSVLNELHKEILNGLTQKDFLKRINISEERIQALLINTKFVDNMLSLINKKQVTCKNVLDLSIDILNTVSSEPMDDWLLYIFQYILNKSFPEAVTIKLDSKYEVSVIIYLEILRTILKYAQDNNFSEIPKFEFLSDEEIEDLPNKSEYINFLEVYDEDRKSVV